MITPVSLENFSRNPRRHPPAVRGGPWIGRLHRPLMTPQAAAWMLDCYNPDEIARLIAGGAIPYAFNIGRGQELYGRVLTLSVMALLENHFEWNPQSVSQAVELILPKSEEITTLDLSRALCISPHTGRKLAAAEGLSRDPKTREYRIPVDWLRRFLLARQIQ